MNDEKLEDIMKEMPQYQAIDSSIAKLEANYEASLAVVNQIVAELEEIETLEQAYVAYGKLIGMGMFGLGTFNTAICYDDNTIGYTIHFPFAVE